MDLYLIAHKVRGEPAFDIAERAACPICVEIKDDPRLSDVVCNECEGDGFWWIISTSGHRAYPWWSKSLPELGVEQAPDGCWAWGWDSEGSCKGLIGIPPDDWPDHYPTRSSQKAESSGKSLLAKLGLIPKVVRRL